MEVLYVTIVDRKIEIHTTTGVLKGAAMLQLERLLSNYGFEKIDQSKLVNMNKVKNFDPNEMKIVLENGEFCPVSRSNKRKIMSHFDKK